MIELIIKYNLIFSSITRAQIIIIRAVIIFIENKISNSRATTLHS